MAPNRKIIAGALLSSCMFLLSGCEPGVHELQQQNAQQQQQINQLEAALAAAQAGAIQQDRAATAMANAQLAYEWAGPLRWLPIWSSDIGQQVDHAPDWKGYLLLGAVWSALLLVVATAATSAWLAVWVFGLAVQKTGLERTIKRLEDQAGPLRDLEKSLRDARSEVERINVQRRKAQDDLDAIERRIASKRQDIEALNKQCDDLRKEAEHLKNDLETLRGFS